MDCSRLVQRPAWLMALVVTMACGCQTVRTPEEKIAKSNLPREFTKVSLPDYVVEPPDLLIVEVLEALLGRPISASGSSARRQDLAGLLRRDLRRRPHHRRDQGENRPPSPQVPPRRGPRALRDRPRGQQDQGDRPARLEPGVRRRDGVQQQFLLCSGDVARPGRLLITGNETVLDAINFAGGLIPTAAPNNIRLVRPAPPGACCEQVLPVNLAAIVSGGDPTTNYQLMPGDRLMVYRDLIIRGTIFIDRPRPRSRRWSTPCSSTASWCGRSNPWGSRSSGPVAAPRGRPARPVDRT
ncbi:MAG: SLBB domain-containing protein [Isosphaeraceae bacterium]